MFDGRPNNAKKQSIDDPTLLSKYDVGKQAGLSKDQQVTANRLSNIPEDQFNHQIESNQVPTLTELSDQGKKKIDYLYKPKPNGFADAIHFKGALKELHSYIKKHDPDYIINAMDEADKKEVSSIIQSVELWFDKFIVKL